MNSVLKRKITDTLHLNNICKRLKSSIPSKNTNNINLKLELSNNNKHTKNNKNTKHTKHKKCKSNALESNNIPVQTHLHHLNHPNLPSYRKEQIPKRIREMVWSTYNGEKYSSKCYVSWCNNIINVFNYQVGHDIPESKGGTLDLSNLKPICGNCNLSMGNKYTITQWSTLIPSTTTTTTTTITNTINTTPIDKQILEKLPESKELIQSHIDIMKTKFNNSKTITKSLTKLENILEEQEKPSLDANKPNKFIAVALLMVIIHILCI
jgi:5-methylcytosine-specific restriction endonuclease McrA